MLFPRYALEKFVFVGLIFLPATLPLGLSYHDSFRGSKNDGKYSETLLSHLPL